jgi:N-methylhydantoinase A
VPVFWPDAGKRVATTVYDGGGFTDGGDITGPALVELPHTTIAVPRAASLTADRGHFRLLLPAPETTGRGTAR